jgi:hypothetical protein
VTRCRAADVGLFAFAAVVALCLVWIERTINEHATHDRATATRALWAHRRLEFASEFLMPKWAAGARQRASDAERRRIIAAFRSGRAIERRPWIVSPSGAVLPPIRVDEDSLIQRAVDRTDDFDVWIGAGEILRVRVRGAVVEVIDQETWEIHFQLADMASRSVRAPAF